MEYTDKHKHIADSIKLKGLSFLEKLECIPEGLILAGYRGSIAHGTYVPNINPNSIDDKDIMGIYVAPKEHYLGFGRRDVYEKTLKDYDFIHYEIIKFTRLLLKANPNVLMMLYLNEKHYIYASPTGWPLVMKRDIFTSKQIYHSFTGYAYGQLKRMEHLAYQGYMGKKRKRLVDKFGYDTKNASHLIRLLRMGIEFLVEGKLNVEREDAPELVSIKQGEWSLEKVKREAEKLFQLARETYSKSQLPNEPDRNTAEQLAISIIKQYHNIDW